MLRESRKILRHPSLEVSCTCVRVPVARTHALALTIETERPLDVKTAREVLASAPGVRVGTDDDPEGFATPAEVAGQGDVAVCRLRSAFGDDRSLSLFVLGDQILKGAALNALQIAELWGPRS